MKFVYELRDANDAIHATGFSRHFWLDKSTQRPVRADGEVVRLFAEWIEGDR